jgi:cytochrome c-type biogenesis protein CcmH
LQKEFMRTSTGNIIRITSPIVIAILLLSGLIFAQLSLPDALAQEDQNFDIINRIAQKMNCPTCTGINLADCRTQTCAQWKAQISDLVDEGYSEQEVLDYFVAQYGTQVLQEPPKSGLTLSLWVLPIIMIVLGGALLFFTMRQWSNSRQTAEAEPAPSIANNQPSPTSPAASDPYLQQVEKDLGLD